MEHLSAVAEQFTPTGKIADIREYGNGNVNDTFLVTLEAAAETRFILQRLNSQVFPRPDLIMRNLGAVSRHVGQRLERTPPGEGGRRFELPQVRLTADGRDRVIEPGGSFWRALSFIEGAETFDTIRDEGQAWQVGYALGMFHNLLSDLPPEHLADTLPGFHQTPGYLAHYDQVLAKCGAKLTPEVKYGLRLVAARRGWARVLEEARAAGRLRLRPIHGDPKVNNVMLDKATGEAVSLVDLDTVKPGLVHYDIGDCLRSGGNPDGEETEDWETVRFDPELGRGILAGYLSQARDFLTGDDYAYLADAIRLLAFELGLRFFTDYLAGNIYFKARRPEHNLVRALVQFRLTESIESQAGDIDALIRELRSGAG
ncbi:MAG TPA: aminoglycoside phosphotransferase family protein [Desulfobaccales bacterium]|nr:aminoglycoside phosphotransferase family protein [Desulfobaccales bacterium]